MHAGSFSLIPTASWPTPRSTISTAEASSGTLLIKAFDACVNFEDAGDPLHPLPLGSICLNGVVNSLRADGGFLFAATAAGTEVVDISNPRLPRRLGAFGGSAISLSLPHPGSVAIAAEHLALFDISEPLIPRILSASANPVIPRSAHLFQNQVFFAGLNFVWSINVSNPHLLTEYREISRDWVATVFEGNHAYAGVNTLVSGSDFQTRSHTFELRADGGVNDLGETGFPLIMERLWPFGDGSRRFLATGSLPGIHTVDLSNPAAPVLVSTYIPASGETRFVHSFGSHIQLSGRLGEEVLFKKPDGRLELVVFRRMAFAAAGLDRTETRLVVTEPSSGLHLFDLTRTNDLVFLGSVALPGAREVRMDDQSAFVLRNGGLTVVDIRQPASPVIRTNIELPSPLGIWMEGSRVYVRDREQMMRVFDVSQPVAPLELGRTYLDLTSYTTVAGGYVFTGFAAGFFDRGIGAIDLRDPAHPVELPRLFGSETVLALEADGQYVRAILGDTVNTRARVATFEAATRRELPEIAFDTRWPADHRIQSLGSFVVLTIPNGFHLYIGVTNPEAPVFLNPWPQDIPGELARSRGNDLVHFSPEGRLQRSMIDDRDYRNLFISWDGDLNRASPPLELVPSLPPGSDATIELLSGPATFDGRLLTLTNTGLLVFRVSASGAEQYRPEITYVTLGIRHAPQTVTFSPPATIPSYSPTLTLTGSTSAGLPLRYVVTSGPGAVDGDRLTITNTGPVTVYAIQDGNQIYGAAVSQPRTIELFDPVRITTQPKPVWVAPGGPFSLSVGFTGTQPTTNRWFRNDVFLTETGDTLEVAEATTNLAGLYHVVVANRIGAVTSHWVTVGVGTPQGGMTFIPRGSAPLQLGTATYQAPGRIRLRGNIAAVVSKGVPSLNLYDISNPDSPMLLSRTATTYADPEDVGLLGDHAYVAIRNRGIRIIDISNLAQPVGVATFVIPTNRSDVVTLTIRDELAYVANGTFGLCILDLHNRTNPVVVGRLALTGIAASVYLDGNKAYIPSWDGGVHIVDVTDPANPVLIRRLREFASSYDSILTDGYLQVTDYSAGLKTWDPENEALAAPVQRIPNGVWTIARSDRFLFGANDGLSGRGYLSLYHLADPSRPASLGYTKASDRIGGVTYRDGRLYLVGKKFSIVDVHEYFPGPTLNASARGDTIRLSWPASATNYLPEAADGLGGNLPWQPVAVPVVTEGSTNLIDLPIDRSGRVFRLRRDGE